MKKKWKCSGCGEEFIFDYYKNENESANEINNRVFFQKYFVGENEEIILCHECAQDIVRQVSDDRAYQKALFWAAHPVLEKVFTYGSIIAVILIIGWLLTGIKTVWSRIMSLIN